MVTAAINVLERIKGGQFRMDDEVCLARRSKLNRLTLLICSRAQTHGIRVGVKPPQKSASGCC
jgi:hypothetical protein